jgi:hypothetical protein
MRITNRTYISALSRLKNNYADLPFYKRIWFSLWSYRLSSALAAIDLNSPTTDQVQALIDAANTAWFFKSIFGFLTQFTRFVSHILPKEDDFPEEDVSKDDGRVFSNYSRLPSVLQGNIGEFLPTTTLANLNEIQRFNFPSGFFQTALTTRKLNKLFEYSYNKDYESVKRLLRQNIDLLTRQEIPPNSNRQVSSKISIFEYAIWIGDEDLWKAMLECVDPNSEIEIITTLLQQYNHVLNHGVTYTIDELQITRTHFDYAAYNEHWLQIDPWWYHVQSGMPLSELMHSKATNPNAALQRLESQLHELHQDSPSPTHAGIN